MQIEDLQPSIESMELDDNEASNVSGGQWSAASKFARDYIFGKMLDATIEYGPGAVQTAGYASHKFYTDFRHNFEAVNNPNNWVSGNYNYLYVR